MKKLETSASKDFNPLQSICDYDMAHRASKPRISPAFSYSPDVDVSTVLLMRDALGYDSYRRHNVQVLDKDTLLLVAGSYIRLHKLSSKKNLYLRSTGLGSISCLAVHPGRMAFASGERGTLPDINLFSYPSCKLKKVLSNGTQKEYVSIKFDPFQGNLLASQGGEPDFNLTIWNWAEEVPLLRCKSFSQEVYNVVFNEDLYGFLVTMGLGHIRFWNMANTFTGLKLKGETGRFGTHDLSNIETCVQFPDNKVLSGCQEGSLSLWEEALLKAEFVRHNKKTCHDGGIHYMCLHEGEVLTLGGDGFLRTWNVDDIMFVDPTYYGEVFHITPLREVKVGSRSCLMCMVKANPGQLETDVWYLQDRDGKVWSLNLELTHVAPEPSVLLDCQGGAVVGCAVSPISHLVATAAEDGTLRVFDCLQLKAVLSITFNSPASSLLWLPLCMDCEAASVIVGFQDGILRKIVFSKSTGEEAEGGEMTGKLSLVFKPHKSKITTLAISGNGDTLASGGLDANVFLFTITGSSFEPAGWLTLPAAVRQLVWTPLDFSYRALMGACQAGVVVEILLPNALDLQITSRYEITNIRLKFFQFHSFKAELLRAARAARRQAEQQKRREEAAKHDGDFLEDLQQEEESEEEEEEEVPESPSPVQQVLYSKQDNQFWMCLGGCDAGYVFLCEFPHQTFSMQWKTPAVITKTPLQAVVIEDCADSPITVLTLDRKGEHAVLGFANGHIRLVQLSPLKGLQDLSAYWDVNVHDDKVGSLSALQFAFDESFLISTGMDGNIFVFDYFGRLKALKQDAAHLPENIQHHELSQQDLQSQSLWFVDFVQNEKTRSQERLAEAGKKFRRKALKELQRKLKYIRLQNEQLPGNQRLGGQDILVNIHLPDHYQVLQEEKLAHLRRRFAWQSEKSRLLLEKAKRGLLKMGDLPSGFAVFAFYTGIQVASYRVPISQHAPQQSFLHPHKTLSISPNIQEDICFAEVEGVKEPKKADSEETFWRKSYNLTKRRSKGLSGTVSRSLKLALKKAHKAKVKREKRESEWQELNEAKLQAEKDDPRDLQQIQLAKATIGDLKLKSDPSHAVKMAEKASFDASLTSLVQLEIQICQKMIEFNEKLYILRKDKESIVRLYRHLDERLREISDGEGLTALARTPAFFPEEIPEVNLKFDAQILVKFAQTLEATAADDGVESKVRKAQCSHSYYKGERIDCPDIVHLISHHSAPTTSGVKKTDPVFTGKASDLASSLRRDINTFVHLQVDFEKAAFKRLLENFMKEFDKKLYMLRKEKFTLDAVLKQADLLYSVKLEEYIIHYNGLNQEKKLTEEQLKKYQEVEKNKLTTAQLKKQIALKTEESEEVGRKSKTLWLNFKLACVDKEGSNLMRFLTTLFKKKVKRKKSITRGQDSDDNDSDEDKSSDSMSSMSDMGSESSASFDPSYCPESLEPDLYQTVVQMQAERQSLDDRQQELKQELLLLHKELEYKMKEGDSLERAQDEVRVRLVQFYNQKIQLLNAISFIVLLQESRIQGKISSGLVLNTTVLQQLYNRIGQLKQEIAEQKEKIKSHTGQHLLLRHVNCKLRVRVQQVAEKCEEDIMKKFGRLISLTKLELVTLNPKQEILKTQLVMERDDHEEIEAEYEREVKALRKELLHTKRFNTNRILAKANLKSEILQLERQMKEDFTHVGMADLLPPSQHSPEEEDRRRLERLVQDQAATILKYWSHINCLHGLGDSANTRLPDISARYPGLPWSQHAPNNTQRTPTAPTQTQQQERDCTLKLPKL